MAIIQKKGDLALILLIYAIGLVVGTLAGWYSAEWRFEKSVLSQQSAIIRTGAMDIQFEPHKKYVLIVRGVE